MKLEKNDIIEADIDGFGYDGEGVAHIEDASIFIRNAIVGERVRAKIIFAKKNYYYAIIESVLRPSKNRVSPPCPYFVKCGGCDLQHIKYSAQLELKAQALEQTLKKQVGSDIKLDNIVPSKNEYAYRNKLFLAVRGEPPQTGFFAKNSHRLVGIDNCLLQSFDAKKLIEIFMSFMQNYKLKSYDEANHSGDIRHLAARLIGGVLVITVVTLRPLERQIRALNDILTSEYQNSYALYSNLNQKTGNVIFGESFSFIGGNDNKVDYGGLKVQGHPASFFQVNDFIAKSIYERIKKECEKGKSDVIINSYAGAGTLSVMLANCAKLLYSVELNTQAHMAATGLVLDNDIKNIICVNDDCKIAVGSIANKHKDENITVILDPPRGGCATEVLEAVKAARVKKIIYISCNPATLARDLAFLKEGYLIESITPYDMFPQTANVEVVTVLEQKA